MVDFCDFCNAIRNEAGPNNAALGNHRWQNRSPVSVNHIDLCSELYNFLIHGVGNPVDIDCCGNP